MLQNGFNAEIAIQIQNIIKKKHSNETEIDLPHFRTRTVLQATRNNLNTRKKLWRKKYYFPPKMFSITLKLESIVENSKTVALKNEYRENYFLEPK